MPKISSEEKKLIRRYLLWFYKTAKEELDRTDRKFTQLLVDEFVLKTLKSQGKALGSAQAADFAKNIEDFREYMTKKEIEAKAAKFESHHCAQLNAGYIYLKSRLLAVEQAIVHFLGKQELQKIKSSYEQEMTRRILEAREHT